jgi:hypothetical protein
MILIIIPQLYRLLYDNVRFKAFVLTVDVWFNNLYFIFMSCFLCRTSRSYVYYFITCYSYKQLKLNLKLGLAALSCA